ncbi:winged helix-turn-helix transcriptional regulator [Candidatus Bathyarchaeota archaeon]|nr:winged helix-turn-helix transcriptional regulator [Candidatus Bathyarchaeota archaeon]
MQEAKQELNKLLETHFCDAPDSETHESRLREQTATFFQEIDLKRRTTIFKALADEKRLKILTLLTFREMCVCELTAALGLTQPNLSHHIKKLENAGLVRNEKRGKWVYYSLDDADIMRKINAV